MFLCAALLLAATGAGGWPAGLDDFRDSWKLSPVESPRKDVWQTAVVPAQGARVLVRAGVRGGTVWSLDWWAEKGARDIDLPDDAFWAILDRLSGAKEWTETDPDGLPSAFLDSLEETAAQGFLCRSCQPRLAAATWVSHGSTHLRTARFQDEPAAASSSLPGLANGITGVGLRSLAAQKGLGVVSANPCREGGGECILEFSGPKGQRWVFRRTSGNAAWSSLEATVQAGPWWSPEWNWDSLRVADRREFSGLLNEWLSADADVFARKLLSPVEPVLSFPVSAWFTRSLPGLRFRALADSLSYLATAPSKLELVNTPTLQADIDGFGRRTIRIGARP